VQLVRLAIRFGARHCFSGLYPISENFYIWATAADTGSDVFQILYAQFTPYFLEQFNIFPERYVYVSLHSNPKMSDLLAAALMSTCALLPLMAF
jgi:hypothetical protein